MLPMVLFPLPGLDVFAVVNSAVKRLNPPDLCLVPCALCLLPFTIFVVTGSLKSRTVNWMNAESNWQHNCTIN